MTAPIRSGTITCIIPAHNEASRIGAVLAAVRGHPALDHVLVVDDGSQDGTAAVARQAGVAVLRLRRNRGKTGALAAGFARVRTSHVLLIDADLCGLTAEDVTRLIQPVLLGQADLSMSLRGNAPALWRWIGVDYITGERLLPMTLLRPHLARLPALPRFGFEVFVNGLISDAGLTPAIVRWPGVSSPGKAVKRGVLRGAWADLQMLSDIFATIPPQVAMRQIGWLMRRRIGRGAGGEGTPIASTGRP